MARKKIGDIEHRKAGITVPYFLNGTTFVCDCLEKTFVAPAASALITQVQDFIEHWLTLTWYPVIEVALKDQDNWGMAHRADDPTGVLLGFKRYYLSISPGGVVLQVDWDVEPEHRKASASVNPSNSSQYRLSQFPLAAPLKIGRTAFLLKYEDSIWSTLLKFKISIEQINEHIKQLVTTKAGIERLIEIGNSESVRLLTSTPELDIKL